MSALFRDGETPEPLTVAEASAFTKTGSSEEVDAFLERLADTSELVHLSSIGATDRGREIRMATIADPPVAEPTDIAGDRTVVLLIGNIHAGEVAGKESLQMLARDVAGAEKRSELHALLEDLVILIVPNLNADGNDQMAPDNRPRQAGPAEVGTRANAQGYDLNRDWTKLDAPETRAIVDVLNEWDPKVIVDTHTTNGSLHGHALTYQGPKHPAVDREIIEFTRGTMLPAIDAAFERATGEQAFFYGNFDKARTRWFTYPAGPRYGTSYRGLRNRISILTEAYAYEPYETRVLATYDYCRVLLAYTAEHADAIETLTEAADHRTIKAGRDPGDDDRIALRTKATAFDEKVTLPGYEPPAEGEPGPEPGEPLGEERAYTVEFVNDFVATESVARPYAYLLPPELEPVVRKLQQHGVEVEVLREDLELDAEVYKVAEIERAERKYEGHHPVTEIEVDTLPRSLTVEHGRYVVRTGQKLGTLAAYLLEPRTTDGLTTWNALDPWLEGGATYPIARVPDRTPMTLRDARPPADQRETGRRLTFEDVHGDDPVDLDGDAVRPRWLDATHYALEKDDELRRVRAATGRSEPFGASEATIAGNLAALPTITEEDAERLAGRFRRIDAEAPGRVFEHAGDLYFAGWDGADAVRLTSTPEREEFAELSPDGAFVAFVREHDLYVIDLETRTERRLTTGGTDTLRHGKAAWVYYEEIFRRDWKAFWWSPDARHLAFLISDTSAVPEFLIVDDSVEPQRIERTRYPKPGQANPRVGVGIVSCAGGPVRKVDLSAYDPGAYLIGMIGWQSDGGSLRIGVMNRTQTWLDVLRVDPSTSGSAKLFRETTEAWVDPPADVNAHEGVWSSGPRDLEDGGFLWLSDRDGWRHIYRYDEAGTPARRVTEGDYDIRGVHRVDQESGDIYFTAVTGDATETHLYRVALPGEGEAPSPPQRITAQPGSHRISMAPGGDLFIDRWSSIDEPPRVALRTRSGALVRMIDTNPVFELERFELPAIDRVRVRSGRGTAEEPIFLEGTLVTPTGFDPEAEHPVWFMTYAGPSAPTVRNSFRGGRLRERLLAEEGIVVFRADPYSASGKGARSAWTAYRRLGVEEVADIRTLIEWVNDHAWADRTRVGMSGGSYGGFMTGYAMTQTDLFSAGVAAAPVTSWRDYDTIYTERYMDTPMNNPDGYLETSVVEAAEHLHGRLLLLHGTIDDNVHMQNSIRLIDALREAGKQFDMFIYPGFRHRLGNDHYDRLVHDFVLETMLGARRERPDEPASETSPSPEASNGVLGPSGG